MKPRRLTVTSSPGPARQRRSSDRPRTRALRITKRLARNGQPRPRHLIRTRAPRGPRTVNSVSWAPPRLIRPAITILGNGESRRSRRAGRFFLTGAGAATAGLCELTAVAARRLALPAVADRGLEFRAVTTTRSVELTSAGCTR